MVVGPVGGITQRCIGALADLGDERAPLFFETQGAVEFGADDKAVGVPA